MDRVSLFLCLTPCQRVNEELPIVGDIQIKGAVKNNTARSGKSGTAVVRLEMGEAEAQILLKACRRYRSAIPSYLQSHQTEVAVIDTLINILAR